VSRSVATFVHPSMRSSVVVSFVFTLFSSTVAIAAPDAQVAPKATSKYGYAWKDNEKTIDGLSLAELKALSPAPRRLLSSTMV
jgi:hypothetical protein